MDLKAGYVINSKTKKISHAIYLDIQNITNNKNVLIEERYNPATQKIGVAYQIGVFPNFIYRMQFKQLPKNLPMPPKQAVQGPGSAS